MTTKLKATCDRILARLPISEGEGKVVGGIIIPDNIKLKDKNPIVELIIESAGPDCKVAKDGDTVIVNKNVCGPIEWNGVEYMVFSEVTAFAIVKKVEAAVPIVITEKPKPLTMDEIKAGLGLKIAPTDDSADLPIEAKANA